MGSVVKAVNRAYDRLETRPFWKVGSRDRARRRDGLVTAGMLLLIVLGGTLGDAIADKANLGGAWDLVWNLLRWPIAFVVVLLFFALVYYLAPNKDQRRWQWVTPGSLVGGFIWLALSGLFALYTSVLGLVRQDVRVARRRHHPAALAQLHRVVGPLRGGAERGARPSGRHPRGGRQVRASSSPRAERRLGGHAGESSRFTASSA